MAETVAEKPKPILFCPRCHRRVELPFKGNVKIKGTMRIACGWCKKGKIIVKGENGNSLPQ
jgi:DNA-directed RNA polymerase subunit RPC12/RpoP